jgi:hypothetical protein
MTTSGPRKPPILGTAIFGTIAIVIPVGLVFIGWRLYTASNKQSADFSAKLGELALQLAVIVIVGALIKVVVDWGTSQRSRYREKVEARREFMRRVRAMHVTIQNARDLMNAHRTAKTWSEQSRRLMMLRPEVEEISEDLLASGDLFADHTNIAEGLKAIVSYLERARKEYVSNHKAVDSDHKAGNDLIKTLDQQNMTWVSDFMEGGKDYESHYYANLTKSKGAMRTEVYGV